jgi:tetratricopeptide (TPR) repeat protein
LTIADSLDVDAVVVGSVRRVGDRVRITAELVRAGTGENLWGSTYDRSIGDVLGLQGEVAQAIADQIQLRVTAIAQALLGKGRPVAPEVLESYLTGAFHLNVPSPTRASVEASVRHFEDAISRDPSFAPAYAGLAGAYWSLGTTHVGALPVTESQPRAVAAATRALELDPLLADAHRVLADANQQHWKWAEAEAGFRRALEVNPNDAGVYLDLGGLLVWLGRTKEGVTYARRGRDLDPLSPGSTVSLGWVLYHARQYDDAIREFRTVLAAEPDRVAALWFLGFALIDSSQFDEAIRTLEKLAVVWNRNSAGLGVLARAYGLAGRTVEARRVLEELEQRARVGYVPPAVFVNAYGGLGDPDRMFAALERAIEERSNIVQFLKTHPVYDPYRSDPRFETMLRRVGLN